MNKLLQYMIGAGNVSDKVLPQLAKAQKGFTALPIMQNLTKYDNIPNPAAIRANAERQMQFKKAEAARLAAERQGTITQAAPKRSAASKAWAIATNPMTALSYKAKGLDIPENFERGSRNSLDMAVDMVNPFGYANAAATIPGDVLDGDIAGAGLKAATLLPFMSEFRGATKGIIPRINPWSYQNNLPQNVMYRGIGKAGMQDALQSGVFRANPNVTPTNIGNFNTTRQFSKAYFSPKFNVADNYGQGFIAEVPRDAATWGNRYKRTDWSQIAQNDIPIDQGRILQKDWLMGYKPVNTKSNIQAFGPNNSNSGLLNYLKSNSIINPIGTVVDYTLGTYKGLRNQYNGLLSGKRRPYFEAFPATEAQKAKVMGMQDEAMKDALDFTKNYWYENGSSDIRPILENKMREILPDLKMASNQSNLERTIDGVPNPLNPFTNISDRLIPSTTWGKGREGLSQDVIDALREDRGLIGGLNIPDENLSLTLRNQGRYYKTPKEIANTVVHESGHTAQNFGVLGAMDEQGIRGMNKTWGEVTTKFDPEYNYFTSNPDTELGRRFKNALVEPYKTSNPFNSQTWRSSPNELHSELMAGKYNMYKQGLRQGMSAEEAMTRATNPLGRELNWLLENKNLNRHFKPSTPHEEKLQLLKLLPAVAPVVAGAALSEQKYGGQPCYKCGGQKMDEGGQTVTNPFWEGKYDFKPINQGTVNTIKDEIAGYIQSPLYAKRQAMHPETYLGNNMGYYNDPKSYQESIASGKRTYRLVDLYDQPTQIKNIGKFKDYYDRKKGKTVINSSNLETVVAHELGHSLFKKQDTAGISSDWENGQYWDNLATSDGKKTIATSLNREEVDKLKKFAYPIGNEDEHYDNRMWGDFANESYADLTAMRHLMYKNGLTKKFGDNINRTIYEKALKNKNIQNDPTFKRMQQKYSPGKIILLNNTIAQNENTQPTINMAKQGGPILDPRGQWAHPGKVTRIPSPNITMQGVSYPVLGIGSNGQQQMMQPGEDYNFGGASYVDEYPIMQGGGGTELANVNVKSKKKQPIIVTDKNNPRLKAYTDSLRLYNMSKDTFNPKYYGDKDRGANWYNFNGSREDATRFEKTHNIDGDYEYYRTGKFPGKIQPTSVKDWGEGMMAPVYKKPTQPVLYQERTYQTETPELQPLPIQGIDANLPELQRVEGPSKWMRSFGAGANQNYWSKVDTYGIPLPGYTAPNQNAVVQPAGPGEDFAKGGQMIRRADGSYSKRGLWDNIRANKGSGKKPTKQMLEQERKIKSKMQFGGLWDTDKVAYLDSTVNANKNLEFIQRAMQDNGMNIPTPKGVPGYKLGQTSSHLMTFDPKSARSYPEVVNMNGTLKYLTGDDAYNYAEDTGEYIQFPNAQQANYFSQNYKKSNYIKVGKQPLEKKHGIKVTYKK